MRVKSSGQPEVLSAGAYTHGFWQEVSLSHHVGLFYDCSQHIQLASPNAEKEREGMRKRKKERKRVFS
jgi:hypothetical protein